MRSTPSAIRSDPMSTWDRSTELRMCSKARCISHRRVYRTRLLCEYLGLHEIERKPLEKADMEFRRYRCHAVVRNYTLTLMLSAMVLGSASKQLRCLCSCFPAHIKAGYSCRVCDSISLVDINALLRSSTIPLSDMVASTCSFTSRPSKDLSLTPLWHRISRRSTSLLRLPISLPLVSL